tara:strand:+ start:250 stop:1227 length:978 start_codon:yes stop_codon:yes gene_type:complete
MNKHILVSVIVLVLLVLVLFSTKNEQFNNFTPVKGIESCLRSVIEDATNCKENPNECIEKCDTLNADLSCNPVIGDINGDTVEKCVENCVKLNPGCNRLEDGSQHNSLNSIKNFLKNHPDADKSFPESGSEAANAYLTLGKCEKRCLQCGWGTAEFPDNCHKCTWSNDCVDTLNNKFDIFKKKWNKSSLLIKAIPDDLKITLNWNIPDDFTEDDVSKYILFRYPMDNVNNVLIEEIPLDKIVNVDKSKQYTIIKIQNNVPYGIQLNMISDKYGKKLSKQSNTVNVTASKPQLIGSSNQIQTQDKNYLSLELLDQFKGKNFEFNIN